MQKVKLLKLAAHLESLPRQKFDISCWVKNGKDNKSNGSKERDCGTVACAFGWCPVVFSRSNLKWSYIGNTGNNSSIGEIVYTNKNGTHYDLDAAMEFFGIGYHFASSIFIGSNYPEYYKDDNGNKGITPKRVARRIRHLVKTGEIK